MAEPTTAYKRIVRIQTRVRKKPDPAPDKLPGEDEQFLVWMDGVPGYFFVPLKTAADLTIELELIAVLREAFMHDKQVKLGFRKKGNNRYISAAWVQN